MSILKVASLGHPVLRKKAKKVSKTTIKSGQFQTFCDDLLQTVQDYDGVGLAAPQVHESQRVIVVNLEENNSRYDTQERFCRKVFINPVVIPLNNEMVESWEGCLSLKDLRGLVPRYKNIKLKALDRNGHPIEFETDTFLSIVLQHEIDHLNGILLIDRVEDTSSLSFHAELIKYST